MNNFLSQKGYLKDFCSPAYTSAWLMVFSQGKTTWETNCSPDLHSAPFRKLGDTEYTWILKRKTRENQTVHCMFAGSEIWAVTLISLWYR